MPKKPNNNTSKQYYSVSLERGLSILRCFTPDRPVWSLKHISETIGLNKTSTYRFANTLVQLGYLKKDPQTKLMRLGPQIATFGLGYFYSNTLREIARPLIDEISDTYNITTELAFYEEDTIAVELNPFPRRDKVAERLWQTLFQKGVLIYSSTGLAGIDGDALLIGPSFVIEENDMDAVVDAIDQAMADVLG